MSVLDQSVDAGPDSASQRFIQFNDPFEPFRSILGELGDVVDRDARLIQDALRAKDRAWVRRQRERVGDHVGLLGGAVARELDRQVEYAATRIGTIGAIETLRARAARDGRASSGRAAAPQGSARAELAEYAKVFGNERAQEIRRRALTHYQQALQRGDEVLREESRWIAARRPPEDELHRDIAAWERRHGLFGRLQLALSRAEATERARSPALPEPERVGEARSGDREPSSAAELRYLLGKEFHDVDELSAVLARYIGQQPDEWLRAQQNAYVNEVEPRFFAAVQELINLEIERDELLEQAATSEHELTTPNPARASRAPGEVPLSSLTRRRLLEIARQIDLPGRSRMNKQQLVDAMELTPQQRAALNRQAETRDPTEDAVTPDEIRQARVRLLDEQQSRLRSEWARKLGAPSAVKLAVDRAMMERELTAEHPLAAVAPQQAPVDRHSFSVRAALHDHAPALGIERVTRLEALARDERERFRELDADALLELRSDIGDPFASFDPRSARLTFPRENLRKGIRLDRDMAAGRLQGATDAARFIGAKSWTAARQRDADARMVEQLDERLRAWDVEEEELRSQDESHPETWIAKSRVVTALAAEDALVEKGMRIESREVDEVATDALGPETGRGTEIDGPGV